MPWKTDDIKRLVELEAHLRGIDPRLALALAEQESGFDPKARSPKGAMGIFQLMPGTARQLKVDPSDVAQNISGGLDYLKQQLDAFGGDPGMAVAAYNAGPGVVQAYKGVPPYKETRGLVSRVMGSLGPSSAEASTPQAQPQAPLLAQAQTQPQAAGMSRLQELEAHLARLEGQAATQTPAPTPAPPTARSTPEQDAAYRASRGQQAQPRTRLEELEAELARRDTPQPAPVPVPAQPPAEEPITPERRFLDLPSSRQLPLEERTQRFKEFYGLRPDLKEEFLRSEEPPSDLTVDIEKPSPTAPRTEEERQARIREELAAWEQQAGRPWREGDPRMPSEKKLGVPDEAPVEEGITKPSTMIPLLMPGAGLKLVAKPAASVLLKQGTPLATRGARAAAEGLSQTAGWTAGRTLETGAVPSPGEIGTEAVLNIGAGAALETLSAGTRAVLRRSRAGKAIAQADEATEAASRQWQQDVQTARQAQHQGQAELYDRALEKATQAQREYQAARLRRDDIIAANQQEYDWAVRSQGEALQRARQVPENYRPETPSWLLYEKFGDAAKDAAVDLAPARTALAEVRASRGVLPDGTVRPFPSQVESMAANLEKATGETSIKTIRDELRRLGPLTRSPNGDIRGSAKQLYGIYADALEASPVANDLLRQANATFRKEMALQDVQEWLRPGHGIVRIDNQGRETINVGALMTRLEKHIGDDTFFARSFTPDELQAMRHDVGRLAGTPMMPRTPPSRPREVSPPDLEHLPGGAGAMRRPPEIPPQPGESRPTVERPRIFPRGSEWASQAGKWGGLLYVLDQIGVSPKTVAALKVATVTQQQGSWLLAKALLTPRLRPLLEAGMAGNGQIHQGTYKAIMAAMNAREKQQMERETKKR